MGGVCRVRTDIQTQRGRVGGLPVVRDPPRVVPAFSSAPDHQKSLNLWDLLVHPRRPSQKDSREPGTYTHLTATLPFAPRPSTEKVTVVVDRVLKLLRLLGLKFSLERPVNSSVHLPHIKF